MSDLTDALVQLSQSLNQCEPSATAAVLDPAALGDAVVVIPAGGFGYRMRGATEAAGAVTQKALLPLPNGETLIGRLIRQYAAAGLREFVALVNYEGEEVEAHLAGGAPWGVRARCSFDPESTGSGRTGAMLNAMARGIMADDRTAIVHNADCPIYHYEGDFPRDLMTAHHAAVRERNALATVVAVDGHPYPYTGMSLRDGQVTSVEMYPFIPVPAHAGITVVSPEALAAIACPRLPAGVVHAPQSKKNFEQDLFPRWAAEGRLAAMRVSHHQWLAVDDRKAYRVFCQALEQGD